MHVSVSAYEQEAIYIRLSAFKDKTITIIRLTYLTITTYIQVVTTTIIITSYSWRSRLSFLKNLVIYLYN